MLRIQEAAMLMPFLSRPYCVYLHIMQDDMWVYRFYVRNYFRAWSNCRWIKPKTFVPLVVMLNRKVESRKK